MGLDTYKCYTELEHHCMPAIHVRTCTCCMYMYHRYGTWLVSLPEAQSKECEQLHAVQLVKFEVLKLCFQLQCDTAEPQKSRKMTHQSAPQKLGIRSHGGHKADMGNLFFVVVLCPTALFYWQCRLLTRESIDNRCVTRLLSMVKIRPSCTFVRMALSPQVRLIPYVCITVCVI